MANDQYPSRETSTLVALFQKAHAKVTALQRMDDQIATMVTQHERLQAEVRAVQTEIHDEFERALRFNSAPSKIAGPAETTAAALELHDAETAAAGNGEQAAAPTTTDSVFVR